MIEFATTDQSQHGPPVDWQVKYCDAFQFNAQWAYLVVLTSTSIAFSLCFARIIRLKLGKRVKAILWALQACYVFQALIQWTLKLLDMRFTEEKYGEGGGDGQFDASDPYNHAENIFYYLTFYLIMSIFYYYGFLMKKTQLYLACKTNDDVEKVQQKIKRI